jgi:hypothetical protein
VNRDVVVRLQQSLGAFVFTAIVEVGRDSGARRHGPGIAGTEGLLLLLKFFLDERPAGVEKALMSIGFPFSSRGASMGIVVPSPTGRSMRSPRDRRSTMSAGEVGARFQWSTTQ